jgi:hypothetical protein
MADLSCPPSCLKIIFGVSRSSLLSASASIITVQSPSSPDVTCNSAAGFVVPMPTLSGLTIVVST